jgi:hypothetical protein
MNYPVDHHFRSQTLSWYSLIHNIRITFPEIHFQFIPPIMAAGRTRALSILRNVRTGSEAHPNSSAGTVCYFSGSKAAGKGADQSAPFSVEVKNARSSTSKLQTVYSSFFHLCALFLNFLNEALSECLFSTHSTLRKSCFVICDFEYICQI